MDDPGGKTGGVERRRSRRTSSMRISMIPNDVSYQSNTGLVIPDDNDDDDVDFIDTLPGVNSNLPSPPTQQSLAYQAPPSRVASRPSSTVKPPDPLVLIPGSGELFRAGPGNLSQSLQSRLPPVASNTPAHNYRLFQNTVPVEADDAQSQHTNGSDLVGSLSHTEDLPPYSRYPEEATYIKPVVVSDTQPAVPVPSVASVVLAEPTEPAEMTAGAIVVSSPTAEYGNSGLGRLSPASRVSTRSLAGDDASDHEINTAARTVVEEKMPANRKWQKRSTRRAWGVVPYWLICLLATGLLVTGIVLGAVMGTLLGRRTGRQADKDKDAEPSPTRPQPIGGSDVAPLSSLPDGLPALDTGEYSLSSLIVQEAPNSCFNNAKQDQAWSCNVPFPMYYVVVEKVANAPETENYGLTLSAPSDNNNWMPKYPWGAAPPTVPNATRMILVNDTFEPSQGTAWWARLSYNKTVIVGQDKFPNLAAAKRTRGFNKEAMHGGGFYANSYNGDVGGENSPGPDFQMGAEEGDTPWICTWPGTVLEVLIYPELKVDGRSGAATDTSSSSSPSPSTAPSTSPMPSPTSMPTFPPAAAWTRRFDSKPQRPPTYPKAWKFKERRVSQLGSTTATCRQVRITNGGRADVPVTDANGQPVEVVIDEDWDDDLESMSSSDRRWVPVKGGVSARDAPDDELSDCGCLWWVY